MLDRGLQKPTNSTSLIFVCIHNPMKHRTELAEKTNTPLLFSYAAVFSEPASRVNTFANKSAFSLRLSQRTAHSCAQIDQRKGLSE